MEPIHLSALAPIAATLNEESNDVNTLLTSLNEELDALNFGISVWLPNPSKSDPLRTIGFTVFTEGDFDGEYSELTRLLDGNPNYKKIKPSRTWQLAVRFLCNNDPNDPASDPEYGPYVTEQPLLKASRNLRIEGLCEVPTILRMIKEEAESRISAIRQAKQLVADLSADRKSKPPEASG